MKNKHYLFLLLMVLTVSLQAQGELVSIKIQDSEGQAISNATVEIVETDFGSLTTTEEGLVKFVKVPRGKIHIQVTHPDYVREYVEQNVSGIKADDKYTITLIKKPALNEVLIFGEVIDDQGREVKGAKIEIKIGDQIKISISDSSGNYHIHMLEGELKGAKIRFEVKFGECQKYNSEGVLPRFNYLEKNIQLLCTDGPGMNLILNELTDNLSKLSAMIAGIELNRPIALQNHLPKRPGELEEDFQQRARQHHLEYKNQIANHLTNFSITDEAFKAHQLRIKDEQKLYFLKESYRQQAQATDFVKRFIDQINHILSLQKNDLPTTESITFEYQTKIIDAKIALLDAAAYQALLTDELGLELLQFQLQFLKINIPKGDREAVYQSLKNHIAQLAQEKLQIMEGHYQISGSQQETKDCERILRDPHLIYIRRSLGWSDTLTLRDCQMIQNNIIDSSIVQADQLLLKAMESYVIADGSATAYYYNKILSLDTIKPLLRNYARLSLKRLNQPEIFEGSLGMYVLSITKGVGFDRAGIKEGDVIYKINGAIVKEPTDISQALMQSNGEDSLVEYYRKGKRKRAIIKKSQQAGAAVSPLISFFWTQL